jgi:GxxExxY protein
MFEQAGYDLIAAAIAVYNGMGQGFLEEVYQECLEIELQKRKIPFIRQPCLNVYYKGMKLDKFYRPDLYVCDGIVAELKAIKVLTALEEAQLFNYMKAARKPVGYLLNFGNKERLDWKRRILKTANPR